MQCHLSLHTAFKSCSDILPSAPSNESKLIQSVRLTPSSQFRSNPFRHVSPKKKCAINIKEEFTNYKIIPYDDTFIEKECETLLVHKKFNSDIKMGEQKLLTVDEEAEMLQEIKLNNALTDFIEKELKIIPTLYPVQINEWSSKKLNLPLNTKYSCTVLLDLDETLIHSFYDIDCVDQKTINRKEYMRINAQLSLLVRDGLEYFLAQLSKKCELIVFVFRRYLLHLKNYMRIKY